MPTSTFLVLLRPGPAWLPGKTASEQPLKEHGKYLLGLYAKGLMKMAGPLGEHGGGAVVLEAASLEEAQRLVDADPSVRGGMFVSEVHPWGLIPWEQHLAPRTPGA